MKILDMVRKEFRYLRLLWTHLSDSISAHDEIVMAKSTLRLEDNLKQDFDQKGRLVGPSKKKAKTDKFVVKPEFVSYFKYKIDLVLSGIS